MPYSSEVAAGDTGLATQYNNLRKDALGIITPNAAAGGVAQYDAVYILAAGTAGKANAGSASTARARGIELIGASAGNACTIQTIGRVVNGSWTWTIGGEIYLSLTDGALTQTPPQIIPGADRHIVVMGWADSATSMLIDIQIIN